MGATYQQRVRDWLAAYVDLSLSARVGTELQSILAQGINTISTFDIGWHIKLAEGRKYALSTIFQVQNYQGSFINLLGFIRDVINKYPDPNLNENIPLLAVASGIRFAWGMNDLIGLKASSDISYGETYTRGENGFYFKTGGGIDFDFQPRYSLPVGLVINYSISSMPDVVYVENKKAQIIQAKIAYTGARDFNLGIEYSYMKMPLLLQEKPPTVQSITLSARYYF